MSLDRRRVLVGVRARRRSVLLRGGRLDGVGDRGGAAEERGHQKNQKALHPRTSRPSARETRSPRRGSSSPPRALCAPLPAAASFISFPPRFEGGRRLRADCRQNLRFALQPLGPDAIALLVRRGPPLLHPALVRRQRAGALFVDLAREKLRPASIRRSLSSKRRSSGSKSSGFKTIHRKMNRATMMRSVASKSTSTPPPPALPDETDTTDPRSVTLTSDMGE